MREVILAKSAGFCYGVRRAVEMAQREAEQGSSCVMQDVLSLSKSCQRSNGTYLLFRFSYNSDFLLLLLLTFSSCRLLIFAR